MGFTSENNPVRGPAISMRQQQIICSITGARNFFSDEGTNSN